MNRYFLLGTNFLKTYYPIKIDHDNIKFTQNGSKISIPFSKYTKLRCNNFSPIAKCGKLNVLAANHWIFPLLKQNFSEDPLKLWSYKP